jgi:hypothetical protein
VVPVERSGGFTRPQYLQYTTGSDKQRVQAIACPHARCRGLCDSAVLLPDVARSGYGVICSTCRRTPNITNSRWARVAFPADYSRPFTGPRGTAGSLRLTDQTHPAPAIRLFRVPRPR